MECKRRETIIVLCTMYVCMYCIHSTKHCESTHMKRVCFGPKPQKDVGMQVGPLHHYHVRSTNDQWHPVEWKFKSYTGNDIISYLYCSKKKKKITVEIMLSWKKE